MAEFKSLNDVLERSHHTSAGNTELEEKLRKYFGEGVPFDPKAFLYVYSPSTLTDLLGGFQALSKSERHGLNQERLQRIIRRLEEITARG